LLNGIEAGYSHVLGWGLRHRNTLLSLIVIVFIGSLALIPLVGTEFFPEVDSGEVEGGPGDGAGTRVEVTAGTTEEMLNAVNAIPEMEASYALAGQTKKGFLTALGFEEGTGIGRIGGRLIDKKERSRHAKEVASELREQVIKLPGVENFPPAP